VTVTQAPSATYPIARHPPHDLRALLWLKSRELLGETRDGSRLAFYAAAYLSWWVLVITGSWLAVQQGRIEPRYVANIAAGAWPLWALVPLLGGGAGEVVAATRLAAFPVGTRAVFGVGWATALLDVPYVIILPLVLGLESAAYGLPGLIAATAFTVGAMGLGQLAAWTSSTVLAGRRRSGVTALLLTGGVVALLAVAPTLFGSAEDVARALPSGWLVAADHAEVDGHWLQWAGWLTLLSVPAVAALLVGPGLTRRALDREARAGGAGARSWGRATWTVRGSLLRALTVADLRCMTRAVGAQVALAGVLAVPALAQMPGVDIAQVSLPAMGTVSAIAAATVLGLNAFAFQAAGAGLLLSFPLPTRQVLLAKALAVAGCLLGAQVAVTLAGVFALPVSSAEVLQALVLSVARAVLLAGLGLIWSVRFPAASDYDSLRARIAAPRSVVSFGLVAAGSCYAIGRATNDLRGSVGPIAAALLVTFAAVALAWLALRVAAQDLAGAGTERVAVGVSG
jgi:hypothetical protein